MIFWNTFERRTVLGIRMFSKRVTLKLFRPVPSLFKHFSTAVSQSLSTEKNSHVSHIPVMCNEVLKFLCVHPKAVLIDMTFGAGGHSKFILSKFPDTTIYALDRDPVAIEKARLLAKDYPQIIPCEGKFSDLPNILESHGVERGSVDGMLFDFGASSMQFDDGRRGFSISSDGPLDMRMDRSVEFTARDVIDKMEENDLYKILKVYGEEKHARKIARAIVESRYSLNPIRTTQQLAMLVASLVSDPNFDMLRRISHPATKVFQALRIFVNNELNEINYGMMLASKYLKVGGRLVTISFHSLEDRIVKRHLTANMDHDVINPIPLKYTSHLFSNEEGELNNIKDTGWESLTKHVVTPSETEVSFNPRSRSAKLRAAVKIT